MAYRYRGRVDWVNLGSESGIVYSCEVNLDPWCFYFYDFYQDIALLSENSMEMRYFNTKELHSRSYCHIFHALTGPLLRQDRRDP